MPPLPTMLVQCECPSARAFIISTEATVTAVNHAERRPTFTCPCGDRTHVNTHGVRHCEDCGARLSRWTAGPECNRCAEAASERAIQEARRAVQDAA